MEDGRLREGHSLLQRYTARKGQNPNFTLSLLQVKEFSLVLWNPSCFMEHGLIQYLIGMCVGCTKLRLSVCLLGGFVCVLEGMC